MEDVELFKKFSYLIDLKMTVRKEIETNEELERIIKEKLDNKYIKFMWIRNGCICFKANKKMREKIAKNDKFLTIYMNEFLTKVLRSIDIQISKSELEVFSDIVLMEEANKIFISV